MASLFEIGAGKALGYTSGGAVTQATDKSTGVTLNHEDVARFDGIGEIG